MRHLFDVKDISVYRSEIMGWSILWVMMLHFQFNQIAPFGFIAQYGIAGVDIFMMVSGLGLYYSLNSSRSIIKFYKKRLLRIFPTYYLFGIVASSLLYHDGIWEYFLRYSTIGFWTGCLYWEWFIPSIVFLYLLSPLFKYIIDQRKFILLTFINIVVLAFSFCMIDNNQILDRVHFFFIYRIPAFIFGMICAYWIHNRVSIRNYYFLLILGIPVFGLLFPHHHQIYNYKYFSLLFLLPLFSLIFVLLSKHLSFLNPTMRNIGKASMEIYLVQSFFFYAIINDYFVLPKQWHDSITLGLIIFCSLFGILIHRIIDKCFCSICNVSKS